MAKTRLPYAAEFRRQMVELVRAGRTPEELATEFEPTAQSIRNWVAQSDRNGGRGDGGLTTAEREELNRLRRENRQLRVEREILSQRRRPGSLGRRTRSLRRVPVRERSPGELPDRHHVQAAGCLLQWLLCMGATAPIAAGRDGRDTFAEIRAAHGASRGVYGAPRVHAELTAKGIQVGRKRIARLMSRAGLAGVCRRKFVVTTVKGDNCQAPDLVQRNFAAAAPDLLWVADITYIPTWAGFLYLAVVLDACSRRIVGWSMATTLAKQLVLDALNMALTTRQPTGVIHHSDQGSQYSSIEFGHRCRDAGVRPSMGSVGDAYDNAMCESFFATLECELLARHRFRTPAEARRTVFAFIEGWYNLRRRHSSIGYRSPIDHERQHQ